MKDLINSVAEYRFLFENARNLEVIDRFYSDNIVQFENCDEPVVGKENLLKIEKANLENVKILEQKITNFVVDEDRGVVMGEMIIRFNSEQSGKKRLEEAFVQKWSNDRIIYQRFYYSGFQDGFL